jgi:hypothetical protein
MLPTPDTEIFRTELFILKKIIRFQEVFEATSISHASACNNGIKSCGAVVQEAF